MREQSLLQMSDADIALSVVDEQYINAPGNCLLQLMAHSNYLRQNAV